MSVVESLPVPAWVLHVDTPDQADRRRLCYLIRLAALFHNETGSVTDLGLACGFSNSVLHMAMKRGQITGEVAVAIENTIGRELFPREMFRPDLFTLPQE